MRKILTVFCFCLSAIIVVAASANASPFASQNLGGQTGLISTPNAQIGWDSNKFGIDGGVHYIKPDSGDSSYVYKVSVSLFQKAEVGAMYDDQPDGYGDSKDPQDLVLNGKFRFYPW
ncbi:MAG TPA: hypothetical protein PKK43_16295 [Spirochaetota bacterium]|nr:hypothetical protein [Spirochaetota bacterium]